MRLFAAAVTTSVFLFTASGARADAPPDAEVARRLAFIESRLDRGTAAADRWFYGWYAGYTALAVGQLGVAMLITDHGLRADAAVAGASSSLGVLALALFPFTPRTAAGTLATFPETAADERRKKLAAAEHLLHKSAEREVEGRSFLTHIMGIGVSMGTGLFLALAYNRTVTGVVTALGGVALTEAQIFTQPMAAVEDEREYRSGKFDAAGAPTTSRVTWTIAPVGAGVGLAASF